MASNEEPSLISDSLNSPKKAKQEFIRSFGRIKSRKLSDHKEDILTQGLDSYEIKDFSFAQSKTKKNILAKKNILEIGFGFGDFLSHQLKQHPNVNFIGAETHVNGIVSLCAKIGSEQSNLKIFREDVRILLKNIPNGFFDEVFILFPDPWPKKKHFKRRLINVSFLQILSQKMAKNGHLTIATDHDSYKTWILSMVLRSEYFELTQENSSLFFQLEVKKDVWNKENCLDFPQGWVETKYQKKAVLESRQPVIFNLRNVGKFN